MMFCANFVDSMPVKVVACYIAVFNIPDIYYINGLVEKRQNTSVLAMELRLFCIHWSM